MFTFFSQESSFDQTMQILNAGALTLAAVQMIVDPSTSFRFGFDLAIHGLTIIAFRNKDNFWGRLAASGANCARLGAIYADATSQGVFGVAEAADVVLHSTNIVGTLLSGSYEQSEMVPSPSHR
ncbi:hypothetical protein [Legionella rowbothamii]|uniref:hypothetical protein n=1 Tax=Legionella rowbothamii TaxID=96229 RepID=UPI001055FA61|nr:hypothetical protein [Legionella rowbothamii]